MNLDGGVPQPIAPNAGFVFGVAWIGDELIFANDRQLMRVSASGGEARPLMPLDEASGEVKQDFPVGSTSVPLVVFRSVRKDGIRVDAVAMDTGLRHQFADQFTQVRWMNTAEVVFSRGDALFVAPFDPSRALAPSAGTSFLNDVGTVIGGLIGASVADNGSMIYVPAKARRSQLVWVGQNGSETPLQAGTRDYQNPRVSPDGKLIAFVSADGLWVMDARGSLTRAGSLSSSFPVWMPDSRRIVVKDLSGKVNIVNADGTGSPTPVAGSMADDYPASVTPDGKMVAVIRLSPSTSGDVVIVPVDGSAPTTVLATAAYEGSPQVSPDGQWLLYSSDESTRMEVYLRRMNDASRRWTISTMGGMHPIWSRDGRRVYYRTGQQMMAADIVFGAEPVPSTPRVVFDRRYEFGPNISQANYSIDADNQRLLMVKPDPAAQSLQVILNWPSLLKR